MEDLGSSGQKLCELRTDYEVKTTIICELQKRKWEKMKLVVDKFRTIEIVLHSKRWVNMFEMINYFFLFYNNNNYHCCSNRVLI